MSEIVKARRSMVGATLAAYWFWGKVQMSVSEEGTLASPTCACMAPKHASMGDAGDASVPSPLNPAPAPTESLLANSKNEPDSERESCVVQVRKTNLPKLVNISLP